MSGPAKARPGGQVLVSKEGFPSFYFEIIPFQFLSANLSCFNEIKSFLKQILDLLNKIICVTKQIQDFEDTHKGKYMEHI